LNITPKIGISALHYNWETFEEAFRRAHTEMELDFIEFSTNNFKGAEDCELAGRIADEYGVMTSLHAWSDWVALDATEAMADARASIGMMKAIRADTLVMHGGVWPNHKEGIARSIRIFKEAAGLFADAGKMLLVENHYSFEAHNELGGTPGDMLEILNAVDSESVRFCLDYGHSHMNGNTMEFIEKLAPWLHYTHIADNHGEKDEHLAMGMGTVDWEESFRATRDSGFPGNFTIEFPEGPQVQICSNLIRSIYMEQ